MLLLSDRIIYYWISFDSCRLFNIFILVFYIFAIAILNNKRILLYYSFFLIYSISIYDLEIIILLIIFLIIFLTIYIIININFNNIKYNIK